MASKTQKNDGYPLPDPVDGYDLICVKLMIPNDPTYIADFRGLIELLGKWHTWDKSNVPGDTRATRAAAYWRQLLHAHFTIGDCEDTQRNCTDYAPSAPIVRYLPQDPFKDPTYTPIPYLLPPFTVVQPGDIVNALLGYLPGDVITTLTRIPLTIFTGGPILLYPTIKIDFLTGGDLTLKLLSIESGGLAEIRIDGKVKETIDLEFLELQFPVQNTKEIEFEVTLEKGQEHAILITFLPKVTLTPPFIGFGGGLRSFTLCTDETINDALERAAKRLNAPYTEVDLEMPRLEVDCDCNAFIVCDDGTRKQLAFADDVPPKLTPETEGTPQPKSGGGTAKYCQTMAAQGKLLLPTTVNAGDIITLESATGAGNDGVEAAWRCVDGSQFFAGACVGFPHLDSGDPVPTVNHMALIVVVGGTAHAFTSGSFTVPGGVSNAEAYIQANDSALLGNFGSYEICVQVQNNQAAAWCYEIDFTLTPGSFVDAGSSTSIWTAGAGWQSIPAFFNNLYIHRTGLVLPSGTVVEAFFSQASPISGDNTNILTAKHTGTTVNATTNHDLTSPTNISVVCTGATDEIIMDFNSGQTAHGSGIVTVTKVKFTGSGTNPFGSSNC